jgi:DNA-binding CsgD family transcriptional regulator
LSPYPLFELAEDGTVVAANSAARSRFPAVSQMIGERRVARESLAALPSGHATLRAWLAGSLYPVRLDWPTEKGEREAFIALPFASDHVGARIALMLVPTPRPPRGRVASAASAGASSADVRLAKQTASLTTRERQIVAQLLAGSRSTLIAEDLGISVNTVRNHLKSIFRKLGVRSQEQLVRALRRAGA